jgi:hypothetical protein
VQGDAAPGERAPAGSLGELLSGYSPRRVRFILAHREAYEVAYLNPGRGAASHEMERLEREYQTLPPRHSCTCRCPNEVRGWGPCPECKRLRDTSVRQDVGAEIGRTSKVNAPMPSPVMLDLARAEKVLGKTDDVAAIARYMSLDGIAGSVRPVQLERHRVSSTVELVCLMCSRPGGQGQRACYRCGGSLMVDLS